MANKVKNIPDAETLINSMRSIGYDFESAVADIIDNSISAETKKIEISFPVDNKANLYLQFVDYGFGMNKKELFEAMRFGSVKSNKRSKNDLGRFGLGLKTASISQCKRLTVVSKQSDEINSFVWDLDLIVKNSDWDMYELSSLEILTRIPNIEKLNNIKSFTIVLWEEFDRLQKDVGLFNDSYDIFLKKISSTEKHISLVFHRFLEKGLVISVNNKKLFPIDPYLMRHPKTTIKPEQIINTKTSEGIDEKVKLQVFVLPYHKDLTYDDYDKIGGLENIDQQGFYIYRNKRLMIHGTWFRIKPKDELSRNARIMVDIPNTLDDLWAIDVKKQKAIIPAILLEQLRGEVSDAVSKSKKLHKYKGDLQTKNGSIWNKIVDKRENKVFFEINQDSKLLKNLFDSLDETQSVNIKKIISLIELSLPYKDIYNSVSEKKNINDLDDNKKEAILTQAILLFDNYKKTTNKSSDEIINLICQYEPFLSANIIDKIKEKIYG